MERKKFTYEAAAKDKGFILESRASANNTPKKRPPVMARNVSKKVSFNPSHKKGIDSIMT